MLKLAPSVLIAVLVLSLAGSPARAEDPSTEDTGIWNQVVALYEQAKAAGETAAEDVYEWAREDLEAIGDWEYKVKYFPNVDHIVFEKKLNELGTERWEVIWIDRQGPNLIVTMKRPSRTWLNKLPLGQLLKVAAPGPDGGNE